jgi:predicted nucleic acid-binding protein
MFGVIMILGVSPMLYTSAGNLCRSHKLRAYDAVQLACALGVHNQALASGAPSSIFVCADNSLLNIAIAEGLGVENPNNHP